VTGGEVAAALTAVAGGLAAALLWVQRPVVPTLDAERWFKVALGTLVRGEVERAGGDVLAFEARVRAEVPYHPAGRFPERKVSNPAAAALPGPLLPGEAALLEALTPLTDAAARVARLYGDDAGAAVLFEDPLDLGPAHDFARVLGPGATWDALAAWPASPAFGEVLRSKLSATLVWLAGATSTGPSLRAAVAAVTPVVDVPWADRTDDEAAAALRGALGDPLGRMVIFAEGEAGLQLLRALVAAPDVRDRVAGVVAVGAAIGGLEGRDDAYGTARARDFLEAKFTQRELETDLVRRVPYLALQWWEPTCWPPGVPGAPLQHQRFPDPRPNDGPEIAEVMDLGPLFPASCPPLDLVARALVAVAAGVVVSRRG
jgi:hypothetical protein